MISPLISHGEGGLTSTPCVPSIPTGLGAYYADHVDLAERELLAPDGPTSLHRGRRVSTTPKVETNDVDYYS